MPRAPAGEMAKRLQGDFGCAVLVKGGDAAGGNATDVLCDAAGTIHEFTLPRVEDPVSTHGTGCSLAAALAAELALGRSLYDAVAGAKRFVHDAIAASYLVGENCGVLGFANGR